MTPGPDGPPEVVGLDRERQVLTVALEAGRHVVIEGPPGTGKSTLLRDIARQAGREVVFAEGNAELTPARLIGQTAPRSWPAATWRPASPTARCCRPCAAARCSTWKSSTGFRRRRSTS